MTKAMFLGINSAMLLLTTGAGTYIIAKGAKGTKEVKKVYKTMRCKSLVRKYKEITKEGSTDVK